MREGCQKRSVLTRSFTETDVCHVRLRRVGRDVVATDAQRQLCVVPINVRIALNAGRLQERCARLRVAFHVERGGAETDPRRRMAAIQEGEIQDDVSRGDDGELPCPLACGHHAARVPASIRPLRRDTSPAAACATPPMTFAAPVAEAHIPRTNPPRNNGSCPEYPMRT